MAKKIERWQADDGASFPTEAEAQAYEKRCGLFNRIVRDEEYPGERTDCLKYLMAECRESGIQHANAEWHLTVHKMRCGVWDALEMLGGQDWEAKRDACESDSEKIELLHARCLEIANHPAHQNLRTDVQMFEETGFALLSLIKSIDGRTEADRKRISDDRGGRIGIMEAAQRLCREFVLWSADNVALELMDDEYVFGYLLEARFGTAVFDCSTFVEDSEWYCAAPDKLKRIARAMNLALKEDVA